MKYILGIDIGTSGTKTVVFDEKARAAGTSTVEYPLYQPQPGWTEQEPTDWWEAVCRSCKEAIGKSGADPRDIAAVGLSGQMHGMVALDENMQVVRRALLWNDQRTQAQCDEITAAAGGLDGLLKYTNNMMLTGYTGGKILWLKQVEPENYAKVRLILNPKDYIRFMLTGEKYTDVSDASGTGFFDVKNRRFSEELLKIIGISADLFGRVVESTDQTGAVTKAAAELTGIAEGTPVFGGGGDAVISTVGAGLMKPGRVGITIGTSGVAAMMLPSYSDNPGGRLQMFCGNAPGTYIEIGCNLNAAGSYQWFRNALGELERAQQDITGVDAYKQLDQKAAEVPAGSDGLMFMPYLTGERCPLFDAQARGGFVGLASTMGKGHFARAVMEGVCYAMKQIYDLIDSSSGIESGEVVASGGGAMSPLWRQILADVFDLPVRTLTGAAHGGALGAALVAGAGAGVFVSLEDAMALLEPETEVTPNPENVSVYARRYASYCKMYDALKWYPSEI